LTGVPRLAEQRPRIDFGGALERADAMLAPLSADEQRLIIMLSRTLA
jgi:hypothetical protein